MFSLSLSQIVRADLKELRDLDLKGAPYGYTPFCDSRKEMEGYRFWKTGYWASHLGHRKYHIRYTSIANCEMDYSSTNCFEYLKRISDILLVNHIDSTSL